MLARTYEIWPQQKLSRMTEFLTCSYLSSFLKVLIFKLSSLLFYAYGCLACMYICVSHLNLVSMEARREHWILWNWSHRLLLAAMWVLELNPGLPEEHSGFFTTGLWLQHPLYPLSAWFQCAWWMHQSEWWLKTVSCTLGGRAVTEQFHILQQIEYVISYIIGRLKSL